MAAISIQRIHRLPDTVINQIAAGEVIERPVSVVKELLENSLDAGARHLTIEVAGGGGRMIRVMDDGHGIHEEDLRLAVDRHTTSKLARAEDLARIGTLGFRGEALSSIAAVSRLILTTRQEGTEHGWMASLAAGDSTPVIKPAPHPVGTTVEVRDLFYNTPARRKFLRSEQSEFLHIQELVKRVALSRVGLALRLVHNGRQVVHVSGAMREPEARMQAVLGGHFSEHSIRIQQRSGDYFLSGRLGLPEAARSQSDQQYFYLNGRSIRDKLITHAVRLACQDRLYPGRQPSYLLYLEMDAALVDVNVHPAKHEVRFRDPRNVHDFVYGCLVQALTGAAAGCPQEHVQPAQRKAAGSTGADHAWRTGEPSTWYPPAFAPSVNELQPPQDGARPIALVHGRYIVAENREGLVLVDSLRARELMVHARLHAAYTAGEVRSRPVLVPLVFPLSAKETELLDRHLELLARLGLVIVHSAPGAMMVRALPLALTQADALSLVRDVMESIKQNPAEHERVTEFLKLLSRHANDCPPSTLALNEMQNLLSELITLRDQITVEGFNTAWRKFDRRDLQDLFDRKH